MPKIDLNDMSAHAFLNLLDWQISSPKKHHLKKWKMPQLAGFK